jgi:hypothetical protein
MMFFRRLDYKQAYTFYTKTVSNMATLRIFQVMTDKFNLFEIVTNGVYLDNPLNTTL